MSQSLSATDHLLVPMNIQAAVVNDASANNWWNRNPMTYSNLSDFGSPEPDLFLQTGASEITRGVHLLWELPAAFRHGIHDPNSHKPPSYPHAPNRWVVVRFWEDKTTGNRDCRAWVLNSDATGGKSPFVNPQAQHGDSWETKFGKSADSNNIGTVTDIGSWAETNEPAELFLQALGPGSVTFSAYSPNVENVFSLVDDGNDNEGSPLVHRSTYVITKAFATGTGSDAGEANTIVLSTDKPAHVSSEFTANTTQFVLSHQGNCYGPYTVKTVTDSTSDNTVTLTTVETLPSGMSINKGAVHLIDQQYSLKKATSNSFKIANTSGLTNNFPKGSCFYITNCDGKNGYYQVDNAEVDGDSLVISVAHANGSIDKTVSLNTGTLSTQGGQNFVSFDYLVMGWYSNPAYDPLHKASDVASWAEQLDALKWTTNQGPFLINSIHTNAHNSTCELWIKGSSSLKDQFNSKVTSVTVVGKESGSITYTLDTQETPYYNKDTETMVLTLSQQSGLPAPKPGEHLYVSPDTDDISYPQNSLLQGQLNSVGWQNGAAPQRPNTTENDINQKVRVAVGNSSIEALSAAFVSQQHSDINEQENKYATVVTGAQKYKSTIHSLSNIISISSTVDLTDSWFPLGSSIVLNKRIVNTPPEPDTEGDVIGTYRIAATQFDGTSTFYIYLTSQPALSKGTDSEEVYVTPSYLDANLMDAFQTNQLSLLEQPGGRTKLELALEKENYRPDNGGTLWKLEAIKGAPIFAFAITPPPPGTASITGFSIDMSHFSQNTISGMAALFNNAHFEVSGSKGSVAGKYKVASTSTSGNTFTITTSPAPANVNIGPTNIIKIAAEADVLPISFQIAKSLSNGFEVRSAVDLSDRFTGNPTLWITGPNTTASTSYTVSSTSYDSTSKVFTITVDAPPADGFKFTSANHIELISTSDMASQKQWLANLNIIQNNLDRETRVLRSIQSECYAWWWQLNANKTASNDAKTALGQKEQQLINQLGTVKTWEAKLNACISSPDADAGLITSEQQPELNAYWQLKPSLKPRFYQPKDPELLIAGLDSSFDIANAAAPNAPLLCRFNNQLISELNYTGTQGAETILASQITSSDLPITQLPGSTPLINTLNNRLKDLSYEAFFLNTDNANRLSTITTADDKAAIALAIEKQAGFGNSTTTAVVPASLAIQPWQQAWMPLSLEWNVNWKSSQTALTASNKQLFEHWQFDQEAWQFDGKQYHFNQPSAVNAYDFTVEASNQLSLTTDDQHLYLNSLIEGNSLIQENSSAPPYKILNTKTTYTSNKLTIPIDEGPSVGSEISMAFEYSVSRQGLPIQSGSTPASLVVKVSPEMYAKLRIDNLTVFIYGDYQGSTYYATHGVQSFSYSYENEQLTLTTDSTKQESITGHVYPVIAYSKATVLEGRTFITPEATFNFRSRLEQYISSNQGSKTAEHLEDVEHILDIIGGQDFNIIEAGVTANTFVVESGIDLDHLFPAGSTCYVSQSDQNNGAYTVKSVSTSKEGRVSITVDETVKNTPIGLLTPAPHQWDLMSQSLSGFTDQLIMRSQKANVSPGGPPPVLTPKAAPAQNTGYPMTGYQVKLNNTYFTFKVDPNNHPQHKKGHVFYIAKSTGPATAYATSYPYYYPKPDELQLYWDESRYELPKGFTKASDYLLLSGPPSDSPATPELSAADFTASPWHELSADSCAANTFCFTSSADLSYAFPPGQYCHFADATTTPHPYVITSHIVKSTSFDVTKGLMSVTVVDGLSGTLTGFIGPDLAALIGGNHLGYPDILADEGTANQATAASYHPIRGGFFEFHDLQIVDRFGQVVDLLYANDNVTPENTVDNISEAWETFSPIKSRALTPGPDDLMPNPDKRLAKLTPGIVTPSRLDFHFVDGSGTSGIDKIDIDLLPDPQPVCGWLLPNHIDGGISVYNPAGLLLGELLQTTIPDEPVGVKWYAAGAAQSKALSALGATDIENPYLLQTIQGLGNQPGNSAGRAFQNLMQAIDETLWAVDETSTHSDQHMALLLGRPLALVRGRLKGMLHGHADYKQDARYYESFNQFDSWTASQATASASASVTITVNTGSANSADITQEMDAVAKLFTADCTISISGQTENAGVYRIMDVVATAKSDSYTLQVNLLDDLPGTSAGGVVTLNPPAGEAGSLEWPVRLGLADLYDDGLIGYFSDTEGFDQFNCVHKPVDMPDAGYLKAIGGDGQNYLPIKFHGEVSHGDAQTAIPTAAPEPGATFITMLMDPRAAVHASTGMSPTRSVALPPYFTQKALETMKVTFRVGPLLTIPEKIQMPLPNERHGEWSWQEVDSSSNLTTAPVTKGGQTTALPARPLTLRDGWLALTDFNTEDGGS